ncbi:MAG: zonular occludens toxin domain-containing protein [Fibrobacter sp.]|nr:zonular occludens toxin domain-containing protein [Fibrobacter sp.]
MPVYCLEGLGGSGKSIYMIDQYIIPWLQQKKHIYHNIEGLKVPFVAYHANVPVGQAECLIHHIGLEYEEVDGEFIEKENIDAVRHFYSEDGTGAVLPAGSLVLIDEGQNYFNSRDFKELYSRELVDYLSRNRHYKHTIVWATQNIEGVDITFRRQTQYIYWLERVGEKSYSSLKIYEGWMKNEYTKPYAQKTYRYNTDLFGCYKSYVKGSEKEEEHREKHNRWLSNKPLMIVIVLFVILVIVSVVRGSPFKKITQTSEPQTAKSAVTLSVIPHENPAPPPTFKGLQPEEGGEGVGRFCYTTSFFADGLQWFKLENGKLVNWSDDLKECE